MEFSPDYRHLTQHRLCERSVASLAISLSVIMTLLKEIQVDTVKINPRLHTWGPQRPHNFFFLMLQEEKNFSGKSVPMYLFSFPRRSVCAPDQFSSSTQTHVRSLKTRIFVVADGCGFCSACRMLIATSHTYHKFIRCQKTEIRVQISLSY